jgi:hypothetical protein
VLRVDECDEPTQLLCLRDDVQAKAGLSGTFRTVYLHDPSPRQSPDSERQIKGQRTRGNSSDVEARAIVTEPHDRALAVLLFDLGESIVESGAAPGLIAARVLHLILGTAAVLDRHSVASLPAPVRG